MIKRIFTLGILGWMALLISACTPLMITEPNQPEIQGMQLLDLPVGQTFLSRNRGLTGINVFLTPHASAGIVTLHLRRDPTDSVDLARVSLPVSELTEGYHSFIFPPLPDSNLSSYYVFLESNPAGVVSIGQGSANSYPSGAMYRNHHPVEAQLAFLLVYEAAGRLLGQIETLATMSMWLGIALLIFGIPGFALLIVCTSLQEITWAERLAAALAIGVAIPPLWLLWTSQLDLYLGVWNVWIPVLLGMVVIVGYYGRNIVEEVRSVNTQTMALLSRLQSPALAANSALMLVALLVIFTRLLAVRTIEVPLWGDSVQHAVMVQLFLDHGGLFNSWLPYAPYESLTVHFGFHAAASYFAWVAGLSSAQATLIFAQLLNAIAVFALLPLSMRIANGNRWAGVVTILVAGLLMPMPAYYVNWGRYAQLMAQAILPVSIWLLWRTVEAEQRGTRLALLTGLCVAGMTISYYRLPYFFAAFVLAWGLVWLLPWLGHNGSRWGKSSLLLILALVCALFLFAPWLPNVTSSNLLAGEGGGGNTAPPSVWQIVMRDYEEWQNIGERVPLPLQILAGVALLWGIVARRATVIVIGLWALALSSLVALRLIGLPGGEFMQNFAVTIAFYIPVSMVIGWFMAEIGSYLIERTKIIGSGLMLGAIVIVGLIGARSQLTIVDPMYIMVTQPDMRAMSWIAQETPADARFLVEGFTIYGGGSAVGADAGWWIPLLAGRANSMPPQYALLNERPLPPDISRRTVELVRTLEASSVGSPDGLAMLCREEITHVYIGQGQGLVGFTTNQLIAPSDLEKNSAFRQLYRQDRVHIYAFDRAVCEP